MNKHFYSHIVDYSDLLDNLEDIQLSSKQRGNLAVIVESSLHHTIVDVILTQLHEDHRHIFLLHLIEDDHDKIWGFLDEYIDDPKALIEQSAQSMFEDFKKDIM